MKQRYTLTEDYTGINYCGLTFEWNYAHGYVDIRMPGYVCDAIQKFPHAHPAKHQYSPHHYYKPTYGKTIQYAVGKYGLDLMM